MTKKDNKQYLKFIQDLSELMKKHKVKKISAKSEEMFIQVSPVGSTIVQDVRFEMDDTPLLWGHANENLPNLPDLVGIEQFEEVSKKIAEGLRNRPTYFIFK
ncbi:hypothetical protein [Bacillus subtilis]|uniref:hypothetical protein n=2 Tax=Bacillus subtilis TaxID=1423 RepID=UPI002E211C3C|nr:hypothetical protein [Bacillus subtilis]